MTTSHFIKLDQYEGPLDLLLHLIKAHQFDIFDIDIYVIAVQYLEHLRLIQFRDLQEAAAFMAMAASLIEMKSRQLLPNATTDTGDDSDDGDDPVANLKERLILLDLFKQAGSYFAEQSAGESLTYTNHEGARLAAQYATCEKEWRGETATLLVLYEQMLSTLSERRPTKVSAVTEQMTIGDAVEKINRCIEKLRVLMFQDLYKKMSNRYEMVAHTLALLQLVRDGELKLYQEEIFGPIWLYDHRMSQDEAVALTGTGTQSAASAQTEA